MVRAVALLLRWGFDEREVKTVIWWANKGNWASRKLAWQLGFSFDGTVRAWLPQRGHLRDAWGGALLAGDKMEPRNAWLEPARIVGERLVLRAHRDSDAARVLQACSDERTASWLPRSAPLPDTLEAAAAYIAGRPEQAAAGTGVSWAMADPVTDDLLGTIMLFDLAHDHDAEIGYWAHPDSRGRGLTSEACGLVVRHAFIARDDGGLGLQRLKLRIAEGNSASRRVAEANGFTQTGLQRRDMPLRDGTFANTVDYDLLREEYSL
jgi:RimJ/RimL family protein N-acetyltransferase